MFQTDQTWFGMPDRSYYLDEKFANRKAVYKTLMYNVALLMGADKDTLFEEVEGMLELETQLANVIDCAVFKAVAFSYRLLGIAL